jgi:cell division protein FtsB
VRPPRAAFDLRPQAAVTDGAGDDPVAGPRPRGATRIAPRQGPDAGDAASGVDAPRPVRVAKAINALLVAVCLLGSLHVVGLMVVEVRRLAYTEGEIARLEAELSAIARDTADLRAVAERFEDERYRELLARRQGYVYPEETRFIGPQQR